MKARLIFLVCFMTAFGAGTCVGVLWQTPAKATQDHWLSDLKLTPEQRETIKTIWTDAMKNSGWQAQRERREAAQKERDAALIATLTPEQKQRYDEIMAVYQKRLDEISQESKKARDEAYERTKAELTESQRVTYEELRKKRSEGRSRSRGDLSKTQPGGGEKNGPAVDSQNQSEEKQVK